MERLEDMPEPMRLFEARRAGEDRPYYVALPDDLERSFDRSAAMVEAALAKRYCAPFGIASLREVGDVTAGGGA